MSDESNKKHAPKRNRSQIEQDRADISRCYLNGMGQREIVLWIASNRPYTLSLGMVNRIVQETIAAWRKATSENIGEVKARDLARIECVYVMASEAFERSCKDLVVERRINGNLCTVTQKRDGDPRLLAVMLNCIKERKEILGYAESAQPKFDEPSEETKQLLPDIEVALQIAYGKKSGNSQITPDAANTLNPPHWKVAMRVQSQA